MIRSLEPFATASSSVPQLHIPLHLPISFLAERAAPILFWLILGVWIISSCIAAYHWLRYHRYSIVILPAFIVYGIVSFALILYAASGFIG